MLLVPLYQSLDLVTLISCRFALDNRMLLQSCDYFIYYHPVLRRSQTSPATGVVEV